MHSQKQTRATAPISQATNEAAKIQRRQSTWLVLMVWIFSTLSLPQLAFAQPIATPTPTPAPGPAVVPELGPKPPEPSGVLRPEGESEEEEVVEKPQGSKPVPEETWLRMMVRKNIEWSQRLDSFADGVDMFLIGRRITTRRNETSIRLENSSLLKEREGLHNTSSINANVRLPNVEDYWQLKFTSYDEREDRRNAQRNYLRQQPRDQNYGASLGLLQSFGPIKTRFTPRVELTNPLRISHSLIFETVADVDRYEFNPNLEFFANPDYGTGVYGALHINIDLNKVWSLTLLNDGQYEENANKFISNNGFSVGQSITERSALSYNIFFTSHNREKYHLDSYNVSIGWSHEYLRKILDYEVIPFVEFLRWTDFKPTPGLTVNVNLTF